MEGPTAAVESAEARPHHHRSKPLLQVNKQYSPDTLSPENTDISRLEMPPLPNRQVQEDSPVQQQVRQSMGHGLPKSAVNIKVVSKEHVISESDQSLNDTDIHFPQQPSSGETMDYKIKKVQTSQLPPHAAGSSFEVGVRQSQQSLQLRQSIPQSKRRKVRGVQNQSSQSQQEPALQGNRNFYTGPPSIIEEVHPESSSNPDNQMTMSGRGITESPSMLTQNLHAQLQDPPSIRQSLDQNTPKSLRSSQQKKNTKQAEEIKSSKGSKLSKGSKASRYREKTESGIEEPDMTVKHQDNTKPIQKHPWHFIAPQTSQSFEQVLIAQQMKEQEGLQEDAKTPQQLNAPHITINENESAFDNQVLQPEIPVKPVVLSAPQQHAQLSNVQAPKSDREEEVVHIAPAVQLLEDSQLLAQFFSSTKMNKPLKTKRQNMVLNQMNLLSRLYPEEENVQIISKARVPQPSKRKELSPVLKMIPVPLQKPKVELEIHQAKPNLNHSFHHGFTAASKVRRSSCGRDMRSKQEKRARGLIMNDLIEAQTLLKEFQRSNSQRYCTKRDYGLSRFALFPQELPKEEVPGAPANKSEMFKRQKSFGSQVNGPDSTFQSKSEFTAKLLKSTAKPFKTDRFLELQGNVAYPNNLRSLRFEGTRCLIKEQVDDLELLLDDAYKEQAVSRPGTLSLRATSKNFAANDFALKEAVQNENERPQYIVSNYELEALLKEGVNHEQLKAVSPVFLIPVGNQSFQHVNDDLLRRAIGLMSATPRKNGTFNGQTINQLMKSSTITGQMRRPSIKKIRSSSNSKAPTPLLQSQVNSNHHSVFLNVINEKSLKDLEQLETALNKQRKKLLDPLKDAHTSFNEDIINPGRDVALRKKLTSQLELVKPLTVTVVKHDEQERADWDNHLIMDHIRRVYFSDFTGYSRLLTKAPRTTSRYYNSHQIKDIVMLQTGGFAREHKALPKWRVQNNAELLNFQVAQLRRTYSYWLQRHSMNDDIKKTLFTTKEDLLMMSVKTTPNEYLSSPDLMSRTIDRIMELCLRPEDIYKLTFLYKYGKEAPTRFNDAQSLDTQGHGENKSMIYVEIKRDIERQKDVEVVQALYLHNHPVFIPYNNYLDEDPEAKIDSFVPQTFRMSTLFGYKSKLIQEGMYEVFEPGPDARYILAKVFRKAFMRSLSLGQKLHHNNISGIRSTKEKPPLAGKKAAQAGSK